MRRYPLERGQGLATPLGTPMGGMERKNDAEGQGLLPADALALYAPALDPRTCTMQIRRCPERLQAAAQVWVPRRHDVVMPGAASISACRNPRTSKWLLCPYPARPRFVPIGSLRCIEGESPTFPGAR
jgi:hypothetical protein